MAQEDDKIGKRIVDSRLKSIFSLISFVLMIFGILYCMIFLCAGIIGVIRGYSVQLPFSHWFIGIVIVCSFHDFFRPDQAGIIKLILLSLESCYSAM